MRILCLLLLSGAAFGKMNYQKMHKDCEKNSCCLASVNKMKNNKYLLAKDGQCPKGFKVNTLKCMQSKKWCEPVK